MHATMFVGDGPAISSPREPIQYEVDELPPGQIALIDKDYSYPAGWKVSRRMGPRGPWVSVGSGHYASHEAALAILEAAL